MSTLFRFLDFCRERLNLQSGRFSGAAGRRAEKRSRKSLSNKVLRIEGLEERQLLRGVRRGESVVLPDYTDNEAAPEEKHNTLTGAKGRKRHLITTCGFGAVQWNQFNNDLQKKYAEIAANEKRYESYFMDEDPDIVVVAFGAYSRVCLSGVKMAREAGLKVGMIRPISLWPFPDNAFEGLDGKQFLVCELNAGQMVQDVKLSVKNKDDVHFFGMLGGIVPTPKEICAEIQKVEVK